MIKYILISVILVCVFGCGKKDLEDKVKDLENVNNGLESENKDLGVKLQKQGTDLESASGVVKEVNALLKNIHETEIKIEEKRHILSSAKGVESAAGIKEDILDSIQELYDDLRKYRGKAVELQEKLDSFVAGDTQQNKTISTLKIELDKETVKVEDMSKKIGSLNKHVTHLKSELNIKENEVSSKELEIKSLHKEINNIFYIIGKSKELIMKKIIIRKGIAISRSLNPFSINYVLAENFTLAKFIQEESSLTEFKIDGKIKRIIPFRNKNHYDITYAKGISFINITDPKNFWHQKYLVIVTK